MHIEFKSNKLKKLCETFDAAKRKWGEPCAKKLTQRLNEALASPTLLDFSKIQSAKCHALTADRKGQYAVCLDGPRRLIFEPILGNDANDDKGVLDYSKIDAVMIIEVVDYHE